MSNVMGSCPCWIAKKHYCKQSLSTLLCNYMLPKLYLLSFCFVSILVSLALRMRRFPVACSLILITVTHWDTAVQEVPRPPLGWTVCRQDSCCSENLLFAVSLLLRGHRLTSTKGGAAKSRIRARLGGASSQWSRAHRASGSAHGVCQLGTLPWALVSRVLTGVCPQAWWTPCMVDLSLQSLPKLSWHPVAYSPHTDHIADPDYLWW